MLFSLCEGVSAFVCVCVCVLACMFVVCVRSCVCVCDMCVCVLACVYVCVRASPKRKPA